VVALALFLAGCGGGDSGPTSPSGHDNSDPSSPSAPSNPSPSTAAIVQSIIDLTNVERTRAGVPTLQMNAKLNTAAQLQADQVAQLQVLEHNVPGASYPTPADRLAAAGYSYASWGENLASGYATAADAVAGWMNSVGHRENILNTAFTEIGAGYATASNGTKYYVQVFGTPR
jgi:uncharacterized protein YkwD